MTSQTIKLLVEGSVYGFQQHGGISRMFTEILSRLPDCSPGISARLHLPAGATVPQVGSRNVTWLRDHAGRPWRLRGSLNRCRLRHWRPNIFQTTYYEPPPWAGMKHVVSVYDFNHEKFPEMWQDSAHQQEIKKCAIQSADAVIAISEATKADILQYCPVNELRIHVIHLAASALFSEPTTEENRKRFLQKHGIENAPHWLYVGSRDRYKNFDLLLHAFLKTAEKTNAILTVVGGAESLTPPQEQLLAEANYSKRVRSLGKLPDEELHLAYATSAAFIYPSLAEGFGIPLVEAMAAGAPVIASDIEVFREVGARAPIYVSPTDSNAMAEAMLTMLDPQERQIHVAEGKRRAADFSWTKTAQQYAEVYRELTG